VSEPTFVDELFELFEWLGDKTYGASIMQTNHPLLRAAQNRDAGTSERSPKEVRMMSNE
jgi:hypothetical protein